MNVIADRAHVHLGSGPECNSDRCRSVVLCLDDGFVRARYLVEGIRSKPFEREGCVGRAGTGAEHKIEVLSVAVGPGYQDVRIRRSRKDRAGTDTGGMAAVDQRSHHTGSSESGRVQLDTDGKPRPDTQADPANTVMLGEVASKGVRDGNTECPTLT